jgi:hypothetical protein
VEPIVVVSTLGESCPPLKPDECRGEAIQRIAREAAIAARIREQASTEAAAAERARILGTQEIDAGGRPGRVVAACVSDPSVTVAAAAAAFGPKSDDELGRSVGARAR